MTVLPFQGSVLLVEAPLKTQCAGVCLSRIWALHKSSKLENPPTETIHSQVMLGVLHEVKKIISFCRLQCLD